MSYTYDDQLHDAIYEWEKLPAGPHKDKLASTLLLHYQAIRREDCGHLRVREAYPDWADQMPKFDLRPLIPKELR